MQGGEGHRLAASIGPQRHATDHRSRRQAIHRRPRMRLQLPRSVTKHKAFPAGLTPGRARCPLHTAPEFPEAIVMVHGR